MPPTISIITTTFNSAKTICDTFDSVINQTYKYIEYIVIDGNSSDGTVDIIKEYAQKFNGRMQFVSETDNGIYDAMNKGLLLASGDIIGILNSDDLFVDNNAVEKVINCFLQNAQTDCVYADLYYVGRNDINKIIRYWKCGKQRPFAKGWIPAHPTFYVKKNIYEKYGIFDTEYKIAADFELMLRFVEKYKIKLTYLPEPLVKMRMGGTTNKSVKNIKKGNIECVKAFNKNNIQVSLFYPIYRLLPKILQFFRR